MYFFYYKEVFMFSLLVYRRKFLLKAVRRRVGPRIKRSFFYRKKYNIFSFVISELLVSGFQYGHFFSRWNSFCIPNYLFIYSSFSYLSFNLILSFVLLRKAILFLRQLLCKGAYILFAEGFRFSLVKQFGISLFREKIIFGFLPSGWLGGTLTNWRHVVRKPKFRSLLERNLVTRALRYVTSLVDFKFLPNALFFFSATSAPFALLEANSLSIPTASVVDSDVTALSATFSIFGNDNSSTSLFYLLYLLATVCDAARVRRYVDFHRLLYGKLYFFIEMKLISCFRLYLNNFFQLLRCILVKKYNINIWWHFVCKKFSILKTFYKQLQEINYFFSKFLLKKYRFCIRLLRLFNALVKRKYIFEEHVVDFEDSEFFINYFSYGCGSGFKKAVLSLAALARRIKLNTLAKPWFVRKTYKNF